MPLGCPNHLQAVEHIAWLSKLSRMYWQYGNMGKTKDSRKHPVSVVLWKSARHVEGNSLQVWSSQSTWILWFDENGAFNRRLLCWKLWVFKPMLSRKTTNAPSSEDAEVWRSWFCLRISILAACKRLISHPWSVNLSTKDNMPFLEHGNTIGVTLIHLNLLKGSYSVDGIMFNFNGYVALQELCSAFRRLNQRKIGN